VMMDASVLIEASTLSSSRQRAAVVSPSHLRCRLPFRGVEEQHQGLIGTKLGLHSHQSCRRRDVLLAFSLMANDRSCSCDAETQRIADDG
jgi:hypothetical protein